MERTLEKIHKNHETTQANLKKANKLGEVRLPSENKSRTIIQAARGPERSFLAFVTSRSQEWEVTANTLWKMLQY